MYFKQKSIIPIKKNIKYFFIFSGKKIIIPELAEKNTIDLFTNKNINLKENGMIELAPFETLCLKILDE